MLGDHSNVHAGSVAVINVLRREVERVGKIVEDDSYDMLVVNGEGSMHHGSRACRTKIDAIREAISRGKKTFLVNSVWQQNPKEFAKVLRGCERVYVREALSQRELARQGVQSDVNIDLSYFEHVDGFLSNKDECVGIAATDFYSPDFKRFVRVTGSFEDEHDFIDMRKMTWSELVAEVSRKSLLLTGRHHGVYAACRARTPFLVLEGNSHKVLGLFKSAGVEIPIFKSFSHMMEHKEWPHKNLEQYHRLFEWMERQVPWRLPVG